MSKIGATNLASEILANAAPRLKMPTVAGGGTESFATHLKTAVEQVSTLDKQASAIVKAFEAGDEVDVTKVMMAREKASLAFEATLQVRNKLLSAYKDIVSMPV
jgi:flagellar hook-basal body complex protein FliE